MSGGLRRGPGQVGHVGRSILPVFLWEIRGRISLYRNSARGEIEIGDGSPGGPASGEIVVVAGAVEGIGISGEEAGQVGVGGNPHLAEGHQGRLDELVYDGGRPLGVWNEVGNPTSSLDLGGVPRERNELETGSRRNEGASPFPQRRLRNEDDRRRRHRQPRRGWRRKGARALAEGARKVGGCRKGHRAHRRTSDRRNHHRHGGKSRMKQPRSLMRRGTRSGLRRAPAGKSGKGSQRESGAAESLARQDQTPDDKKKDVDPSPAFHGISAALKGSAQWRVSWGGSFRRM